MYKIQNILCGKGNSLDTRYKIFLEVREQSWHKIQNILLTRTVLPLFSFYSSFLPGQTRPREGTKKSLTGPSPPLLMVQTNQPISGIQNNQFTASCQTKSAHGPLLSHHSWHCPFFRQPIRAQVATHADQSACELPHAPANQHFNCHRFSQSGFGKVNGADEADCGRLFPWRRFS